MIKKLKVSHLNVRSLQAHLHSLRDLIIAEDIDIMAITESWLFSDTPDDILRLDNFCLIRKDFNKIGRGLAIYIRSGIDFKVLRSPKSEEHLSISVTINSVSFVVCVTYRCHAQNYKNFIDQTENIISVYSLRFDNIFIMGDMNIDLFKVNDVKTISYNSFLDGMGLLQLINEPTREMALLDHIIALNRDMVVTSGVMESQISDHDATFMLLKVKKPQIQPKLVTIRDFRSFRQEVFVRDLMSCNLEALFYDDNIDEKVHIFTVTLISLFNLHAPFREIKITKKPKPWITDNIKFLISLRNKAKSKYRRTTFQSDWVTYKHFRNFTNVCIRNEKRAYLLHKLSVKQPKSLYKELRYLGLTSTNHQGLSLPVHLSGVNEINNFFINSVTGVNVMNNFDHVAQFYLNNSHIKTIANSFSFSLTDNESIQKILNSISTNSCGSDGVTISMLRWCGHYIVDHILNIVNSCLLSNYYPRAWKQALVSPLPKTPDPSEFSHLRPISILPILSKVLEKVMYNQLYEYVEAHDILPDVQSGFRKNRSCTTALLTVTDDIMKATDSGKISLLVLLDFSKAFDTINHEIMIAILKHIGLSDNALDIMRSYLGGRSQRVKLGNNVSNSISITSGVPQGSILSPLLFNIYTSQFITCIEYCNMHMYADDTQIYCSFFPADLHNALIFMNKDLDALHKISRKHGLKLNPSKSLVLLFGNQQMCDRVRDQIQLKINGEVLPIVESAKNLGLIMDNTFRYKLHVDKCIKRAYANLRMLFPHRSFLPVSVKLQLCNTLVLSQFNYCCQVYSPCLDQVTSYKIQKVQNACLRFSFGIRKFQHVSHKLFTAKWLNMKNRYVLYQSSLFQKIMLQQLPGYLYNRITYRTDIHNINIRRRDVISLPPYRLDIFKRSFSYNIYKLYNSLPFIMKSLPASSFKKAYFVYLFESQELTGVS